MKLALRVASGDPASMARSPPPRIAPAGGALEREADSAADAVVANRPARVTGSAPHALAQRKCAACAAEEEQLIQRKPDASARPAVTTGARLSQGAPLPAPERAYFEPRFGQDFAAVRVHADADAAASARALGARAYTAGRDIVFGEDQYRPQTAEGRRLLAHELTHVLQQARGAGAAPALQRKEQKQGQPMPSFPGSIAFRGCDEAKSKSRLDFVKQSTENAFFKARDGDCIKNESLRRDILAGFDGLTVVCDPERIEGRCAEAKKDTRAIILSKLAFDGAPKCPSELAATIFHEVVHVAEGWSLFHGNLSWDCGEACFPGADELKRGNPAHCDYETGWTPFAGLSAGAAFADRKARGYYARIFAGAEHRGPILSIFRPSVGLGLSFIGEPTGDAPQGKGAETSKLLSLAGALRIDPGKPGGPYISIGGGPGIAFGGGDPRLAYEASTSLGYRWHIYDVSLNAGVEYDPTRQTGDKKLYTVGLTFQIAPSVR